MTQDDIRLEINKKQTFYIGCCKCDGRYVSHAPDFGKYVRLICDKCEDELKWFHKRASGTTTATTI